MNGSPSSIAGVVLCAVALYAAWCLASPIYWVRRGIHRFQHRNDHKNGRINK